MRQPWAADAAAGRDVDVDIATAFRITVDVTVLTLADRYYSYPVN